MKYLFVPELSDLTTRYFKGTVVGSRSVYGAVEAYSCKKAGTDKRLAKELDSQLLAEFSESPEVGSALGPLGRSDTRQLLISLICTLNAAFEDYEFSSVRPNQFHREMSVPAVVNEVNDLVVDPIDKAHPGFKNVFWKSVNDTIEVDNCEIYRFKQPIDGDEGHIAVLTLFFFNKVQKKILFFHTYSRMTITELSLGPKALVDDDEDDEYGEFSQASSRAPSVMPPSASDPALVQHPPAPVPSPSGAKPDRARRGSNRGEDDDDDDDGGGDADD